MTREGASLCSVPVELEEARSGGSGKKLQLLAGRAATRAKISESRRCWTAVSLRFVSFGVDVCRGGERDGRVGCRISLGAVGRCC